MRRAGPFVVVVLLAWLPAAAVPAAAQPALGGEDGMPYVYNYAARAYGAQVQNWAVTQDRRGVLYVGNGDGVLEYDGRDWRLIPLPNHSTVRSLALGADGRVYVGGQQELGVLTPDDRGRMAYTSLVDALPEAERDFADVWQMHVTSAGIHFLTHGRLFRWQNGEGEMRSWRPAGSFHTAFAVRDTFYVRQRGVGLMRMDGDSLVVVPGGARFADERVYVMVPHVDGRILVGTRTQGLFLFDGAGFEAFPTEADGFLQEHQLYHGTRLPDGTYALGTRLGGVAHVDASGRFLARLDGETGLHDETVNFTFVSSDGSLWLALNDGLARLALNLPFTHFDEARGLEGIVLSLARHDGRLHVGTTRGLYVLEPSRETERPPAFRLVSGLDREVFDLQSVGATLLAATQVGVVAVTDGGVVPLTDRSAFALTRSRADSGLVYVGTVGGVGRLRYRLPARRWEAAGMIAGPEGGKVRHVSETGDGALWASISPEGLLRVRDAAAPVPRAEHFGVEHGLPEGYTPNFRVGGRIFFASNRGLFVQEESGRFVPDSTFRGAVPGPDAPVTRLVEDADGTVWIHADGVSSIARPSADGGYQSDAWALRAMPPEPVYALYPDADGVAWFGGEAGLVRYDGRRRAPADAPFDVLVQVQQDDSLLFAGAPAGAPVPELPYAENAVQFAFAAPTFVDEARSQYRFRLDGFDADWSPWTDRTSKEYTNLPPGDYAFRVQGRSVVGTLGREAGYRFAVLPPWYRTAWAYALFGLVVGSAVFGIDRVQRRRLLRKERARSQLREHELRVEAAEAWANYLQAENERQTQELEQARRLQLSMLPEAVPEHPLLEIAAFMETATEVGGDYYDFDVAPDGTFTFVIGDATGHGVRAGTMVTATKALFNLFLREPDLERVVQASSAALKRMNLSKMFMALALGRVRGTTLEMVGAGLPPALWYRAAAGSLQTLSLKGVPLGCFDGLSYPRRCVTLAPGDVVLLMTDGLPEQFSEDREMMGDEHVRRAFRQRADASPDELIRHLVDVATAWRGDEPVGDDMTFLAFRVKHPADA